MEDDLLEPTLKIAHNISHRSQRAMAISALIQRLDAAEGQQIFQDELLGDLLRDAEIFPSTVTSTLRLLSSEMRARAVETLVTEDFIRSGFSQERERLEERAWVNSAIAFVPFMEEERVRQVLSRRADLGDATYTRKLDAVLPPRLAELGWGEEALDRIRWIGDYEERARVLRDTVSVLTCAIPSRSRSYHATACRRSH